ncbi:MAG: DUF3038 domain-containing protein [Spirulina sp. SIO3F2]|nr:DUF3038 domain-containing protein [Spirulina sp. SIO3F2]
MSQSVSRTPTTTLPPRPKPLILDTLPTIPDIENCSPRSQQQIDLLLLALEALELGGSEYMLATVQELELQVLIPGRVVLWKLRCTNPWRRSYNRNSLTQDQAKALTIIAGSRAKQLNLLLRQLLAAQQELQAKGLPPDQHYRLSNYLERFQAHFRSRMNPRRAKVARYLSHPAELQTLALELLTQLLFCAGAAGVQRLWVSLFDGEVI